IFIAVWDSGVAGVGVVRVEAVLHLPPIWQAIAITISPGTAPDEQRVGASADCNRGRGPILAFCADESAFGEPVCARKPFTGEEFVNLIWHGAVRCHGGDSIGCRLDREPQIIGRIGVSVQWAWRTGISAAIITTSWNGRRI